MKLAVISTLLTSSLVSLPCFADTAFDYCDKLPGKWHAAVHIKDRTACSSFNGCDNLDLVTFKKTGQDEYKFTMYYSRDGKKITVESFPFSCNGSQLHFVGQEGKRVDLQCDEFNHCYMVVDTEYFNAELIKQ